MPFIDRKKEAPTKQEHRIAKAIGGKRVAASGALPHNPGDAKNDRYLIDTKETDRSFTLSVHVVRKLCAEAASVGKTPAFQVDLQDMPEHQKSWVIMPLHEWLALNGYDE